MKIIDDFLETGITSAMQKEHERGFELGYESCMQVMKGVMKAALSDKTLIEQSSRLNAIEQQELPELGKALAVALHIARDKNTYHALLKENASPLNQSAVKMLLKEMEDIEDVPNPLMALAGYRNKPPQWN